MLQEEHSAILLTFIKLLFVIKIFVLSIFEWPFYTGFTVFQINFDLAAPDLKRQGLNYKHFSKNFLFFLNHLLK